MKLNFWIMSAVAWILVAGVFSGPLGAQEVAHIIDLEDGDALPDYPFGMRLSEGGSSLYVAVAGTFYNSNNRIVEIDPSLDTVVRDGLAGNYPEEIEIRYDSGGLPEKIFVSNNSDGTVSVLNSDLSVSGLVDLNAVGGQYPFGLLMGPLERYLYASTVDAGQIFRIDTDPGPTYLDVVELNIDAEFNGRMALHGGKLVIPGSDDLLGAVLTVIDPTNPAQAETVVLDSILSGWPSAIDVAVVHGMAYTTVLDYNGSSLLYEVDLEQSPPSVSRTIDLSQSHSYVLEHGIGASPDGNTLVVACIDGPLMVVSRKAGRVIAELDLTAYGSGQGNEAVFSADGAKVYVSDQGDPSVYVLTGVPEHGLLLAGTESAPVGGAVDLSLKGGEAGGPGWFVASLNLGPVVLPGFTLDLGFPIKVLFRGRFGGDGVLNAPSLTVPAWSVLPGSIIHVQGLTRDGDGEFRPSNLHEVAIM